MVSRRKILSRSRDDLNLDQTFAQQEEEEDIWYQKDKLYKEHIQEVLDKWTQIDDEIWAKVIVFERNRRVAKAYARTPVLTINGSDDGFDGMRIGLCGFDNPMRDQKTEEMKRHVGQGVKIKMDDAGNILIRRYSKSNVYVKSTASSPNEETAIGAEILKLPNQALESEKIVKLFDMKKFQSNVNRELRRAYPDRRRLETQCLSTVAFVKSENDVLECPVWVLIINVVAMDMLKSKLPPVQRPVDIKNRPRIPIPDEDPYSVAGNSGGSSGSSGFGANGGIATGHVAATREQLLLQTQQLAQRRSEKPPKLPPRDNFYPHDIPKPDYDDIEAENRLKTFARGKSDKGKDNKKYDDPYYCGLRARVPNFVKTSKSNKEKEIINTTIQKKTSVTSHLPVAVPLHQMHPIHQHPHIMAAHQHHQQQMMWHARSYESGIGIYSQMNYMLDHPFNCPYRDFVHNNNNNCNNKLNNNCNNKNNNCHNCNNLRLFDTTLDNRSNLIASPNSFVMQQNPYLRNSNNDYFLNSRSLQPKCELHHSANKWRSESDIFDMDKDETDTNRTNENFYDSKQGINLPLSSIGSDIPHIPRTSFSNGTKKKSESLAKKTKLALSKSDATYNSHRLDKTRKKSTSTDSFFRDSLNRNSSDQDLYEKVRASEKNFNTQKAKSDQHRRSLLSQKDSEQDTSQETYSAEVPAVQLKRQRGRSHSRINDNIKRDRSLYDYRSSSSKFESDMESIYGYLKPRKTRNHGFKQFTK